MVSMVDALVVELSLDSSKFVKGSKDAESAFVKTKDEAVKSGKVIEEATQKAAESIGKVAGAALALYAVFLGGRGLKEFVSDLVSSDSALGRFAANLSTTPQTIAAWGAAVERMGGSSEGVAASFQSLSDKIEELHLRGKAMPDVFYQLQVAGGKTIELNRGIGQTMIDIAANLKAVAKTDQTKASWLGRQLGLDPDTVNLMIKYGGDIGAEIERLKRLGPNAKQIEDFQKLQETWAALKQEAWSLGRVIFDTLGPSIERALKFMQDWIDKNAFWLNQKINEKAEDLGKALGEIKWQDIKDGANAFADALGRAAGFIKEIMKFADGFSDFMNKWAGGGWAGPWGTRTVDDLNQNGDPDAKGAAGMGDSVRRAWRRRPTWLGGTGGGAEIGDAASRGRDANTVYHDSNDFYDAIIQAEGTGKHGNPYDTSLGYMKSPKPLSQMTMGEALAWGDKIRAAQGMNSSAKGAFQIVNTTQRAAMKALGIRPDEPFNEENQRRMASWIYRHQGAGAWEGFKRHADQLSRATAGAALGKDTQFNSSVVIPKVATGAVTNHTSNSSAVNNSSSEMHIGAINVSTQATDAYAFARDLRPALQRNAFTSQANGGPQ